MGNLALTDPARILYEAQRAHVQAHFPSVAKACDGLKWWAGVIAKQPNITLDEFRAVIRQEHTAGVVQSVWSLDLLLAHFQRMAPEFRLALIETLSPRHAYAIVRKVDVTKLTGPERAFLRVLALIHVRKRGHDSSVLAGF